MNNSVKSMLGHTYYWCMALVCSVVMLQGVLCESAAETNVACLFATKKENNPLFGNEMIWSCSVNVATNKQKILCYTVYLKAGNHIKKINELYETVAGPRLGNIRYGILSTESDGEQALLIAMEGVMGGRSQIICPYVAKDWILSWDNIVNQSCESNSLVLEGEQLELGRFMVNEKITYNNHAPGLSRGPPVIVDDGIANTSNYYTREKEVIYLIIEIQKEYTPKVTVDIQVNQDRRNGEKPKEND